MAELPGCGGEPFVEQPGLFPPFGLFLPSVGEFSESLAAVGGDEGDDAADPGGDGEGNFEEVVQVRSRKLAFRLEVLDVQEMQS